VRLLLSLVGIGLAAGLFGALFGVGGGIIMVPLLLLVTTLTPRPAMATSLLAVGLIAVEGTIFYAAQGDVKPGAAAIVGLPATIGVVIGTSLQQRLATRTLTLVFAVIVAAVGVRLLV
jgi:uncharacterized membrane protein YfcA